MVHKFYISILIYFRVSFWIFKSFWIYLFGFSFLTFWYFFYLVKFVCGETLPSRLWKSFLFLSHSSRAWSWVVCIRFAITWILISLTFIDFYCWSLFWDSLLYSLGFCGNRLFEFYGSSTDWLPPEVGSGCGELRSRLPAVSIPFLFLFTCTLLLRSSFAGIFRVRFLLTF